MVTLLPKTLESLESPPPQPPCSLHSQRFTFDPMPVWITENTPGLVSTWVCLSPPPPDRDLSVWML